VREHVFVPVIQWDERLTTREAQKSRCQSRIDDQGVRDRIDSAAAVIMLQNYLDGSMLSKPLGRIVLVWFIVIRDHGDVVRAPRSIPSFHGKAECHRPR